MLSPDECTDLASDRDLTYSPALVLELLGHVRAAARPAPVPVEPERSGDLLAALLAERYPIQ